MRRISFIAERCAEDADRKALRGRYSASDAAAALAVLSAYMGPTGEHTIRRADRRRALLHVLLTQDAAELSPHETATMLCKLAGRMYPAPERESAREAARAVFRRRAA